MSDIVLKWVGRAYVGHTGWPARDLTQEELDARGLDIEEMLAHRPTLYTEVKSESLFGIRDDITVSEANKEALPEEVEPAKPARKKGKRVEKETSTDIEDAATEQVQEQE